MTKKINCIMLIDDNPDDNFYHERIIRKSGQANTIITRQTAMQALEYLKSVHNSNLTHPDLIFLDINMPCMNGWEFLEEYGRLDKELQSGAVIIMLTTSENMDDKTRTRTYDFVSDFKTKPLTKEMLEEIIEKYFRE